MNFDQFPYFPTSVGWRQNEFRKLINYHPKSIQEDTVFQSMHGLALAWSYMPHSFAVKCNNLRSPLETFNGDKKAILKKMKIMSMRHTPSSLRKTLKMMTGSQGVSNFRPTAAYVVYRHFLPEGGLTWDMCGGYGGRLLGAIKSNVNYIATEPCKPTFDGLKGIASDFKSSPTLFKKPSHQEILITGSEVFVPDKNSLDLAFTSPPYFDTEKYSNESTQSYIKYPTKEKWVNGFLRNTIANCRVGLKKGKHMIINISNVPSFKNLEEETIRVATEEGFSLEKTLLLALSKMNGSGFKYEPMYVFQRTA